jgi:hypothetical protein
VHESGGWTRNSEYRDVGADAEAGEIGKSYDAACGCALGVRIDREGSGPRSIGISARPVPALQRSLQKAKSHKVWELRDPARRVPGSLPSLPLYHISYPGSLLQLPSAAAGASGFLAGTAGPCRMTLPDQA